MAQERQEVSFEELAFSNMLSIEALVRVLIRKGIITQEEILQEIREIQKDQNKQVQ